MTKSQENKVEYIKSEIEYLKEHMHKNGEVKKFEMTEDEYGTVRILAEVGSVGDEETLAAIYCRDKVHVFIGKRGGIFYYDNKKFKRHSLTRCYQGAILSVTLANDNF